MELALSVITSRGDAVCYGDKLSASISEREDELATQNMKVDASTIESLMKKDA